jgi:hypothetical protein
MAVAERELALPSAQQGVLKDLYYAFEAAWRLNKQQAGERGRAVLDKLRMASGVGAATGSGGVGRAAVQVSGIGAEAEEGSGLP